MRNKNLIWESIHIEGVPEEMGADEGAQGVNKRARKPLSQSLRLKQSWKKAERHVAEVKQQIP